MAMDLWSTDEFKQRLQEVGSSNYHHVHPVHLMMHRGKLTSAQFRGWVVNRFHYQRSIPLKDAAIISNCSEREVRRIWLHRISDHDGTEVATGGIEAWMRLAEACGLVREELSDDRHLLPGVRFAVDAYVNLARTKPWPIAIASSLTELFAPDLMSRRLEAFQHHYSWVPSWGFEYFRSRVTRARSDAEEGLILTLQYCNSPDLQRGAVEALRTKCEILWAMLTAIQLAYEIKWEPE
jgi:pyrroloquinoline-quinone synthase